MHGHRRQFLSTTTAAGALACLGDCRFLNALPAVSAQESKPDPAVVRFQPDIEPLVRLLEETPRSQVLEKVAARIQQGCSYREILTALLLAGIRNIQPRPSVGFKFHAVLVVNSAHLASLSAPDSDRWLPILWAIDEFKSSQARDIVEGNWTMSPVDEARVPPPHKAEQAFVDAMDQWDVDAADVAVAGLARSAGAGRVFDLFVRYGMRDFRDIGHKAIFVANSWRTLQCVGWQHAEPVLRSLAYALLNHRGEPNPNDSDLAPDRPWRKNLELMRTVKGDWKNGQPATNASRSVVTELHQADAAAAAQLVTELLKNGTAPSSIYDGLLLSAGEILMRQPGIIGIHAVTTSNAMRYAFEATSDEQNRLLLLLQNAAFLPLFREASAGRGKLSDARVLDLQPELASENANESLTSVFQHVSGNRMAAARQLLGHLDAGFSANDVLQQARRLIFLKGSNSHDYKFSSAALEDYSHIAPELRNQYLATSVFNLRGAGHQDNQLVQRIRSAFSA